VINKADRTTDPERAALFSSRAKFWKRGCIARWARSLKLVPQNGWKTVVRCGIGKNCWRVCITWSTTRQKSRSRRLRPRLQRLSEQLLAMISEDRDALQRPIEESERRIKLMKETISEAERSMRELNFCLWRTVPDLGLFLDRHKQFFVPHR